MDKIPEQFKKSVDVIADADTDVDVDVISNRWNEHTFSEILLSLGEDITRDGLRDTPARIHRAWLERLRGYTLKEEEILERCFPNEDESQQSFQICENVYFSSTCEHHLMPFNGWCSVAYQPIKYVTGLSKLARLVDCFAQRLQIQERMTGQIAHALYEFLEPSWVVVVAYAQHGCCTGRGVKRESLQFTTVSLEGDVTKESRIVHTMMRNLRTGNC